MIPSVCQWFQQNQVTMTLFQNGEQIKSQVYDEYEIYPLYVHQNDYAGTDQFALQVVYEYYGSTKEDFTVKVYSKQDIWIKDPEGYSNQIHMDGREPSGFTSSRYIYNSTAADRKSVV